MSLQGPQAVHGRNKRSALRATGSAHDGLRPNAPYANSPLGSLRSLSIYSLLATSQTRRLAMNLGRRPHSGSASLCCGRQVSRRFSIAVTAMSSSRAKSVSTRMPAKTVLMSNAPSACRIR